MARERIAELDILKCIGIVIVVTGHTKFIEDSQILADAMCCQIIAFINSSFE